MKRISTSFISIALLLVGSLIAQAEDHSVDAKTLTLSPVETQASSETMDLTGSEGNEVLHIDKNPLLTLTDFTQSEVTKRKGRVIFLASLTDAGAAKLKEFSSHHVGQRVAILADGQVIATPKIRIPLKKSFELDALTQSEAENLSQLINRSNTN